MVTNLQTFDVVTGVLKLLKQADRKFCTVLQLEKFLSHLLLLYQFNVLFYDVMSG